MNKIIIESVFYKGGTILEDNIYKLNYYKWFLGYFAINDKYIFLQYKNNIKAIIKALKE
jgi:hypothetical protein